jgi:hypothetical protein
VRVSPRGVVGVILHAIGTFQGVAALPVGPRMPANGFLGVGWCDCMGQNLKPLERRWALSGA